MHPAGSVIAFTTLTGAGYGLLFWLGMGLFVGQVPIQSSEAKLALLVATVLVTLGLLSSTLHLAHRERAWRALSQWRSSWLSREGVAAVITYIPIALALWVAYSAQPVAGALVLFIGIFLCLSCATTVVCTGMIYASLKSIARWHNRLVVPVYLLFALMSGAVLAMMIVATVADFSNRFGWLLAASALTAWGVKWFYWRRTDATSIAGSVQSATGLKGEVRVFDPPHTEENYLLKEMGFIVARKHARKLRMLALLVGLLLPLTLVLLSAWQNDFTMRTLLVLASMFMLAGVVVERWLFFAEARHTVNHYYGR